MCWFCCCLQICFVGGITDPKNENKKNIRKTFDIDENLWKRMVENVEVINKSNKFINEDSIEEWSVVHMILENSGFSMEELLENWEGGVITDPNQMLHAMANMLTRRGELTLAVYRLIKLTFNETRSRFTKIVKGEIAGTFCVDCVCVV